MRKPETHWFADLTMFVTQIKLELMALWEVQMTVTSRLFVLKANPKCIILCPCPWLQIFKGECDPKFSLKESPGVLIQAVLVAHFEKCCSQVSAPERKAVTATSLWEHWHCFMLLFPEPSIHFSLCWEIGSLSYCSRVLSYVLSRQLAVAFK